MRRQAPPYLVELFPDYDLPFSMCTDASILGFGAILMQSDERGKNHVIAYASRLLNAAESNYSTLHLETLAVMWALRHFKIYDFWL